MSRPKTKGEPLSFRLSIEAYEELCRRASKAGVTPQEHLIASLEKTLGDPGRVEVKATVDMQSKRGAAEMAPRHEVTDTFRPDDFERNEITVKMEPPPQFEKPFDITHVIKPGENTETRIDGFEVHVPLRQFLGLDPPPKPEGHLNELDEQCIPPDCPVVTPEEVEATYTVMPHLVAQGVYETDDGPVYIPESKLVDKGAEAVRLMHNLETAVEEAKPKFGKHPSWRLNSIGVNVCTLCGEPKGTARQLCMENPL